MLSCFSSTPTAEAVPLRAINSNEVETVLETVSPAVAAQARLMDFKGQVGRMVLTAGADGALAEALIGVGDGSDGLALGAAAFALPEGDYALTPSPDGADPNSLALAWALGAYRFTRYKAAEREPARLVPPGGCDIDAVERQAEAVWLARDLINTPTEDMGPAHLADAAEEVARAYGAHARTIVGDALLTENYPMVHAVGRAAASDRAPRLVEMEWGPEDAPRIAIVGKGVVFDTGGLNIKVGDYMRLMKKDMAARPTHWLWRKW